MSLLEQPDQVLLLTLRQEAGAGRVERLERERHKQDLNEDGLASVPKNQLFKHSHLVALGSNPGSAKNFSSLLHSSWTV